MGRNKPAATPLGRQIIKDRFKNQRTVRSANEASLAHTTDLDDGSTWNRTAQSITELGNLDDFLATAELAGTEFTAEKLNVHIVDSVAQNEAIITSQRRKVLDELQKKNLHFLRIPRRPRWDKTMAAEVLQQAERDSFMEWRRNLASLQDTTTDLIITPFERNIEFWRQLWRVIERSDLVVQIVDARNPLLFRCDDLDVYVKEIGASKQTLLLLNKADLLTVAQRQVWADHLRSKNINFVFFSAMAEKTKQEKMEEERSWREDYLLTDESVAAGSAGTRQRSRKSESSRSVNDAAEAGEGEGEDQHEEDGGEASDPEDLDAGAAHVDVELDLSELMGSNTAKRTGAASAFSALAIEGDDDDDEEEEKEAEGKTFKPAAAASAAAAAGAAEDEDDEEDDAEEDLEDDEDEDGEGEHDDEDDEHGGAVLGPISAEDEAKADSACRLFSSEDLHALFAKICSGVEGKPTVGLVGYPNVGKSSTINALCKSKKVSVSQTPGKTKHFQTIQLDNLLLCDCPGLVFPNFVNSRAEMVCNGILPIDQLRDVIPPVTHVCLTIPRAVLESTYGISIIKPAADDPQPDRPPTAFELLNSYSFMRGYMNARGLPDVQRGGRYVLKDYVSGKLLYCRPPPGLEESEISASESLQRALARENGKGCMDGSTVIGPKHNPTYANDVDTDFFRKQKAEVQVRGVASKVTNTKRHHNKHKREKIRVKQAGLV